MNIDKEKDDSFVELITELDSVNDNESGLDVNATSISDNNGGRIELDEESGSTKSISK